MRMAVRAWYSDNQPCAAQNGIIKQRICRGLRRCYQGRSNRQSMKVNKTDWIYIAASRRVPVATTPSVYGAHNIAKTSRKHLRIFNDFDVSDKSSLTVPSTTHIHTMWHRTMKPMAHSVGATCNTD